MGPARFQLRHAAVGVFVENEPIHVRQSQNLPCCLYNPNCSLHVPETTLNNIDWEYESSVIDGCCDNSKVALIER